MPHARAKPSFELFFAVRRRIDGSEFILSNECADSERAAAALAKHDDSLSRSLRVNGPVVRVAKFSLREVS